MARDMKKKNAYDEQWKKKNTVMYGVRIKNSTGIPEAMEKVNSEGTTTNAYIIQALTEKLHQDGYLSTSKEE